MLRGRHSSRAKGDILFGLREIHCLGFKGDTWFRCRGRYMVHVSREMYCLDVKGDTWFG